MKLNDKFLAVQWERSPTLKRFYLDNHLHPDAMVGDQEWQDHRTKFANAIVTSPKDLKIYYLTKRVIEDSAMVNVDKIDLKWFSKVRNGHYMYVTGLQEFYRFHKTDQRINILNWFFTEKDGKPYYWYDCYSILLDKGVLAHIPGQDQERSKKFVQSLLYVELGEVTVDHLKIGQKIKYGNGGDDKVLNETGLNNVYLVNSNWNRITIVEGGFTVRGHLRVQPCGVGRSNYKLVWVREYEKGSFVRRAGREMG